MELRIAAALWVLVITMVLVKILQHSQLRNHLFKVMFCLFSFFVASKQVPVFDAHATYSASQDPWKSIEDQNIEVFDQEASAQEVVAGETYVVKPGDNLWKIAQEQYGENVHLNWLNLIEENTRTLISQDPNLIYPGENIRLTP